MSFKSERKLLERVENGRLDVSEDFKQKYINKYGLAIGEEGLLERCERAKNARTFYENKKKEYNDITMERRKLLELLTPYVSNLRYIYDQMSTTEKYITGKYGNSLQIGDQTYVGLDKIMSIIDDVTERMHLIAIEKICGELEVTLKGSGSTTKWLDDQIVDCGIKVADHSHAHSLGLWKE